MTDETQRRVEFKYAEEEMSDNWSAEAKMQHWHYRTGHLPESRIRNIERGGNRPVELATCRKVQCSACMHMKATKRNWRTRAPVNQMKVPPADRPGAVIGVDHLMLSTPRSIGQMKGFLTTKQHRVTTVFVDHYSSASFVHFQQSTSVAVQTFRFKCHELSMCCIY